MTLTVVAAQTLAARTGGTVSQGYGDVTVDVDSARWVEALTAARDDVGLTFFDWLSAVDELDAGFSVVCHLVDPGAATHLLLRTRVTLAEPVLATATGVFAGAGWHERETFEMFGIDFTGHPNLVPLLLPDGFVGRPLRKSFALEARVAGPAGLAGLAGLVEP
jgi:NADH-quinone oxidoreductase subunit C